MNGFITSDEGKFMPKHYYCVKITNCRTARKITNLLNKDQALILGSEKKYLLTKISTNKPLLIHTKNIFFK